MKNKDLKLKTVDYVPDLEPYIERKLFSVNTGHATTAYTGKYLGYTTIGDAIKDPKVFNQAKGALAETRSLLLSEFKNFDEKTSKTIKIGCCNVSRIRTSQMIFLELPGHQSAN